MAVPRHRGLGASALTARAVEAISSPGRHQETTPLTRAGAEAAEPHGRAAPVPPRPAAGSSHAGQADRQPVRRRLGVSRAGRPRRLGGRAGQTHDRTAPPVALAACVARGRDGVPGRVADRTAACRRTRGLCVAPRVGRSPRVPRTWAVRQAVAAGGQPHGPVPLGRATPGRPRQEPPRRWPGPRVSRDVAVAEAEGRPDVAARRWRVVPARPLAAQAAAASAAAPATAAAPVAAPSPRVAARWLACVAAAAAALAEDDGPGQGRRRRKPRPGRDHGRPYRGAAVTPRQTRPPRGRPPTTARPQATSRSRLRGEAHAHVPAADPDGGTVRATTVAAARWTDTARLQADPAPHRTGEPGCRWSQQPAASSPVWRQKPARRAACALRTVGGWLVEAGLQRPVRRDRREPHPPVPGNQGLTAAPTAAVVCTLLAPVLRVPFGMDEPCSSQVHGVQLSQLLIGNAVGRDSPWDGVPTLQHNSLSRTTPP